MPLRRLVLGLAVAVGTALAAWGLAHAIHPDALAQAFARVSWWWVALAGLAYAASQFASGLVWHTGLTAGGMQRVEWRHVLSAHWIGRGACELLPAQLGEGVRVAAIRRHPATAEGGCARIAGRVGAFKLIDGLVNFVTVAVATLIIPLPGPAAGIRWIALFGIAGMAVSGVLLWRIGPTRVARRLPGALGRLVENVARGAAMVGDRRHAVDALALQLVATAGRIVSLAALLTAFGAPASAALLAFSLLVITQLLPVSPGGAGVREAALVPALVAAYGFAADQALAFSLGIQALALSVSVAGGLLALGYHQVAMSRLRRAILPAPLA